MNPAGGAAPPASPFSQHWISIRNLQHEYQVHSRVVRRLTCRANWLYLTWQLAAEVVQFSSDIWQKSLDKIDKNLRFSNSEFDSAGEELVRRLQSEQDGSTDL